MHKHKIHFAKDCDQGELFKKFCCVFQHRCWSAVHCFFHADAPRYDFLLCTLGLLLLRLRGAFFNDVDEFFRVSFPAFGAGDSFLCFDVALSLAEVVKTGQIYQESTKVLQWRGF